MKLPETLEILLGKLPDDNPFGVLARYNDPHELLHAAESVRKAGYKRFDVYSSFPIHGMNKAAGVGRSILPWIVLGGGLTGFTGALALMIWINVYDYPIAISGKPYFSLPAFIPITFELTVLFSAFAAFFGMLILNFLPMLYHPLLKNKSFARATSDGFFLFIEARDPKFSLEGVRRALEESGSSQIEIIEA